MNQTKVKIYLYDFQPEKVMIDTFWAEDFKDFLVIRVADEVAQDPAAMAEIQQALYGHESKHKIIVVSESMKFGAYGIREEEEDSDN